MLTTTSRNWQRALWRAHAEHAGQDMRLLGEQSGMYQTWRLTNRD
jgi:hypothetical protein